MSLSPFGVEHEVAKKAPRDYSRAREKYERQAQRAHRVETTGQATASTAGALLGGAALRDQAFKDHPRLKMKMQLRSMDVKPAWLAEKVMHGRPGLAGMTAVAAGSGTAYLAGKRRKRAEKKVVRYSVQKAFEEPGGLMHAQDVEIAKRMATDDATLKRHKKIQGALGATAATTGLLALTSKTGARMMPKLIKSTPGTGKGAQYQRHLDKTADMLLFGASGIGGASGLHQSAIYRAESRKRVVKNHDEVKEKGKKAAIKTARLVAVTQTFSPVGDTPKTMVARRVNRKLAEIDKAFDPERSRRRRSKAYEGAAIAGAAGSAGMAVRSTDAKRARAKNRAQLDAHEETLKSGRRKIFQGMKSSEQASAELSYLSNLKPAARGMGTRRAHDTMRTGIHHMVEGAQKLSTPKPKKVTVLMANKTRAKWAGAALGGAAAATAIHRQRNRSGQSYRSWYDG